jgi:hypothetical protein
MCEQKTEILVLKLAVTILTTVRVTGLKHCSYCTYHLL